MLRCIYVGMHTRVFSAARLYANYITLTNQQRARGVPATGKTCKIVVSVSRSMGRKKYHPRWLSTLCL